MATKVKRNSSTDGTETAEEIHKNPMQKREWDRKESKDIWKASKIASLKCKSTQ